MSVNLKKQRQSDFFDKGKGAHKSEFLEAVGSASILFSLKFDLGRVAGTRVLAPVKWDLLEGGAFVDTELITLSNRAEELELRWCLGTASRVGDVYENRGSIVTTCGSLRAQKKGTSPSSVLSSPFLTNLPSSLTASSTMPLNVFAIALLLISCCLVRSSIRSTSFSALTFRKKLVNFDDTTTHFTIEHIWFDNRNRRVGTL